MGLQIKHLLFDNDGTVVDSEIIAQRSMLDLLAVNGLQLDEKEYSQRFPGLLEREILQLRKIEHDFDAPPNFMADLHAMQITGFEQSLRAIPGMTSLFRNLQMPKSMVSNGSIRHVRKCLNKVKLLSSVNGHIFSAEQVEKPKPHPDVYFLALETLRLKAVEVIVVEDSPTGVKAAKSAGLQTIGFLGAAHLHDGHDKKLLDSGADHIAGDSRELARIFDSLGIQ